MTERLDIALRDLADELVFPPTPDLRRVVAARLGEPQRRSWFPGGWSRAIVLAVIASLLVAATAAALVLSLPGLRLTFVPTLPTADAPDGPFGARLALGQPIAPETVDAGIPTALGSPDEAYVVGDHEVLTLVYAAGDDLPELAGTRIGLLVQVIDGELDRERVQKLVAEVGASVTPVEIDGAEGFWIDGPPHLVRYASPSGERRAQMTRLVGDTLVWQRDEVLYRIESGLGLAETRRIAESIDR